MNRRDFIKSLGACAVVPAVTIATSGIAGSNEETTRPLEQNCPTCGGDIEINHLGADVSEMPDGSERELAYLKYRGRCRACGETFSRRLTVRTTGPARKYEKYSNIRGLGMLDENPA